MTTREKIRRLTSKNPWLGPFIALVVVYFLFLALRPDTMARPATLVNIATQTTIVGIAAIGGTLIIVLGGIDLSVGSAVALTTVVVAYLLRSGSSPAVATIAGLAAATAAGLANGLLTTSLRITPFIVTLGTMSILRGAATGLAGEQKIDPLAQGLDSLVAPSKGLLGFPLAVWLLLFLAIVISALMRSTRFGRHVFAVGSNERTARLSGIEVPRVKIAVYALAGLLTGLAGLVQFSRLTVGDPTVANGLELQVIASVVIGGGALSGGEGSVLGTLLGALLMTVISVGCSYMGLANWVQGILTGVIIIVAVALDRVRRGG